MTFAEFELHRPKLARALRSFSDGAVEDVLPCYEDDLLFSALVDGRVAVCLSQSHPSAFHTDGLRFPTWAWEDEIE